MDVRNFDEQILQIIKKLEKINIRLDDNNFKSDINDIENLLKIVAEQITKNDIFVAVQQKKTQAVAMLNTMLSGDLSTDKTSEIAIGFICELIDASVGVIYFFDETLNTLKLSSSYAIAKDKLQNEFLIGDGSIGSVAFSKKEKIISNPNVSNLVITSSYASYIPATIYTFPLVFQGELAGVVEIGSSTTFSSDSIELIRELNIVLSAFMLGAIRNEKIKVLLNDAQMANEKLQVQSEELQQANTLMEEQQQQLEETNSQLEEQQQQLEEANAQMQTQQQQMIQISNDLKEKNKNLELSDKYKSEFLANMSHELRTPLNSVILLSELLIENSKNNLSDDDIKKARIINSSGNELLKLINDILDLSKIESGKMDLLIDDLNTSNLIQDIKQSFEYLAKSKGLEFICKDNLNINIKTDFAKLKQVVKNLLSNAFKFTSQGEISVIVDKSSQKGYVDISIKDSGIGIDSDKLEIIFDAFKQADGTTSRQYGGTGLGLSISKEILRLLKGNIKVNSKKGVGSEFIVSLPLDYENSQVIKEELPKQVPLSDNISNLKYDDKPYLIIDDDEKFLSVLVDKFHSKNEKVISATCGKNALEILSKDIKFKGIILDLGLPDIDGIEILKELKSNVMLKTIPVYVVSGKDRKDIELEIELSNSYEQKPLTNSRIDDIIASLNKLEKLNISTTQKNNIDFTNKKILVADDDVRNIYILTEALESRNAKVITALNGLEAIEKLKVEDNVDLILMDIMMPVMNGFDAISQIKASDKKDIPIIAITAKAMLSDKQKCIDAGANDYISKPFNMDVFLKIIKAWL